MKRFIEGVERSWSILFPVQLDVYGANENAARLVDALWIRLALRPSGSRAYCASKYRTAVIPSSSTTEDLHLRLAERLELAMIRRCTVEHPSGTLKAWIGATHVFTTRLPKARTEMILHVPAYNMKRIMSVLGTAALIMATKN